MIGDLSGVTTAHIDALQHNGFPLHRKVIGVLSVHPHIAVDEVSAMRGRLHCFIGKIAHEALLGSDHQVKIYLYWGYVVGAVGIEPTTSPV
jgi:hypothetical protein